LLKEKLVEKVRSAIQMGIVIKEISRITEEMDMVSTLINKAISIMKEIGVKIPETVNLSKRR
jgi:hypothetical protein